MGAEKEASIIVTWARQRKIRRIQQAKDEATTEIKRQKLEIDRKLKELQQHKKEDIDKDTNENESKTKSIVNGMKEIFAKSRDNVVQMHLNSICLVEPVLHKNYIK